MDMIRVSYTLDGEEYIIARELAVTTIPKPVYRLSLKLIF